MDPTFESFLNSGQTGPVNNNLPEEGQPVSYPNEPVSYPNEPTFDGYIDVPPSGGYVDFSNPFPGQRPPDMQPGELLMLEQELQQHQELQPQQDTQPQHDISQQHEIHQQQGLHQQQHQHQHQQQVVRMQPPQPPQPPPPLLQQHQQQQQPPTGMQLQQPLPLFGQHLRQDSVQTLIQNLQGTNQYPWGPMHGQMNGQVNGQMNGQMNGHMSGQVNAGNQYHQQHILNGSQQPSPIDQQSPGGFPQNFPPAPSHVEHRTSSNDRVPLPPQHSRTYSGASSPGSQQVNGGGGEQAMVVQASGPMSSGVVVPQRPRPGRKPIPQEDAADRRRLQNRIAQRNFRDKRQQKLQEALAELEEKKQAYQNEISNLRRTLESSRQDLLAQLEKANQSAATFERRLNESEARARLLEQQNDELRKREELRNQQSQASIASFRPHLKLPEPTPSASHHSSVHTPPEDISPTTTNYNELETDYTSRFASSNLNLRPTASNDHMDFSYTQPSEDPCGFCTDTSNCLCAATKEQQQREQHEEQIDKRMKQHTEAATTAAPTNGPGSCDMCRQDPERAKACRDLANSASMGTRPPTGHGPRTASFAETNVKTTTSMPPPPMSCTAMIDAFNKYGERTSSISTLFGGRLNAYPARTGGGYEIEEKQAAEVLATLSRRSTQSDSGIPGDSPRKNSTATS